MTAWFFMIFGVIQNTVMAQVVIFANVTSHKDGVPVEFVCKGSTPELCTYGFWKVNDSTICSCHKDTCYLFGGDRYQCFGNDSAVRLIISSLNQSLDNFPLHCQCGNYTDTFEYSPTSNVTGPTTSQLPANETEIVGGICGGILGLAFILIGAFIFYRKKRSHGGEKTGNKKKKSRLGSEGGPQDFAESSTPLFMDESKSTRESEDRRNSSDDEEIELSQMTYP